MTFVDLNVNLELQQLGILIAS